MGEPIHSRILDYVEEQPPDQSATHQSGTDHPPGPEPLRSRILDYAEAEPPLLTQPTADRPPGPKPDIPPYHTPVFVPAHPRYVDTTDGDGRPTLVPFVTYELFEHPTDGTVAFAFTTLEKLVAALGEAQPWIAASIGPLAEGVLEHGVQVCLDPRVAPGHHNWQPDDLAAYAQEVR